MTLETEPGRAGNSIQKCSEYCKTSKQTGVEMTAQKQIEEVVNRNSKAGKIPDKDFLIGQ